MTEEEYQQYQERRRAYWREQRQRIKQDPEKYAKRKRQLQESRERRHTREELLEYHRKKRREWYEQQKQDAEKWNEYLRKAREYCRTHFSERIAQWCAVRDANHKQRMLDDPVYAYYHREFLKAKYREQTGKTDIDPSQPR